MLKKTWKTRRSAAAARTRPGDEEPRAPREIKDPRKARERTMNRAFNLLSAKPRSVAEMRERLLEKDWTNAEIVDQVLEKLKEYDYLNDAQYAENYAASNLRQKPQGRRKLQVKLAQKKVDKETAAEALEKVFEETPEADLIDAAIERRLRLKGAPRDRDETKKFFDFLLRQGFGFDLVREKMRALPKGEAETDEAIADD